MQIALIDDDVSFRKLVQIKLRSIFPSADFSLYGSLAEIRTYLKDNDQKHFDLVVCDEHLPDGRGSSFIAEGLLGGSAILSVSSDADPELFGSTVEAGARFFLRKEDVSARFFTPLVHGLLARSELDKQAVQRERDKTALETVKTLVSTLRHEINNPLGAVFGAVYLLKQADGAQSSTMSEAAELVETSSKRIKHVLDELCATIELEPVTKAEQKVFHIPGDPSWEDKES